MNPYAVFLVSVLYRKELLKVALKVHTSRLPEQVDGQYMQDDLRKVLYGLLPLHCQTGPILEVEQIFDVEVVEEIKSEAQDDVQPVIGADGTDRSFGLG